MRARLNPLEPVMSRRRLLGGVGAPDPRGAVAAGRVRGTQAPAKWLSPPLLQGFEADVQAAMDTFGIPGAAVALVEGDQIVYARGFGVRELDSQAPVTPRTRFRIASNTKSMTSLLVATFVDEGLLGWDTPVIEAWPAFRAPTDELTRTLRVRDLLGNGSGVAESPTIEFFMMAGSESAHDLLRSVADLPVIAPPNTEYYYNNTLFCVAGFLGPLLQQTPPADLVLAYAALLQ